MGALRPFWGERKTGPSQVFTSFPDELTAIEICTAIETPIERARREPATDMDLSGPIFRFSENTTQSPFNLRLKMGAGVPKTGIIFSSEIIPQDLITTWSGPDNFVSHGQANMIGPLITCKRVNRVTDSRVQSKYWGSSLVFVLRRCEAQIYTDSPTP